MPRSGNMKRESLKELLDSTGWSLEMIEVICL